MSSDHEAEIRASVGAHQDLGSGYSDAVAEGLVERIGAEIDKRIDARLGQSAAARGPQSGPQPMPPPFGPEPVPSPFGPQPVPPSFGPQPVPPSFGPQPPVGYPPYQGYYAPMLPPGYPVPTPGSRSPSPAVGQRNVAMTIIALGSMALGVAGTAIVSHTASSSAQAVMVLLIWTAIVVINIAYARRH